MLNNILHLENVKKIEKKEQKSIAGGGVTINNTIGIYCGYGHPYCCRECGVLGYDGGALIRGNCYCSNN